MTPPNKLGVALNAHYHQTFETSDLMQHSQNQNYLQYRLQSDDLPGLFGPRFKNTTKRPLTNEVHQNIIFHFNKKSRQTSIHQSTKKSQHKQKLVIYNSDEVYHVTFKTQMEKLNKFNINRKNIICYCTPDILDIEEDGVNLALLTTENKFVEISNEKVISEYKFDFPLSKNILIVLKKAKSLIFHKKINNVKEFSVKGCLNGKPQVSIIINGTNEPLLTDFSSDKSTFKKISGIDLSLAKEKNDMQIRIKKLEKLLTNKKQLMSRLSTKLIGNVELEEAEYENLVCAFGQSSTSERPTIESQLSISNHSVRIYKGFLFISFLITNNHSNEISNLEVYIAHREFIVNKSILFINEEETSVLPSSKQGYLLCFLEEPLFYDDMMTFCCILKYKHNSHILQSFLNDVNVDVTELKQGLYNSNVSANDLLALKIISYKTILFCEKVSVDEINEVIESLDFKKVSKNVFLYYKKRSYLNDSLIVVGEINECSYSFYTADENKFIVLFKKLRKVLGDVCFNCKPVDTSLASQAMKKELECLKKLLFDQLNDENNESLNENVVHKLAQLEMDTVKKFSEIT